MDQIITAIVTALSTGAAFIGKEAATPAVKDAYAGLKAWIQHRYSAVNIEQLEKQPTSEARQEAVAEGLERAGALKDVELVQLAQTLAELIQGQLRDATRAIGVDLHELNEANVTFRNVSASKGGTGIKIDTVTGGSLQFGDVTASSEVDPQKKP